ncbi:MAG TPA: bacillithiol biosynthesis deacetylase BshB1 [Candidatus Limnocylindrales bacterium]|nr:bacillithiol biosynthesis deacetylase BshB1 [Candidatus Limnocylindrales bacterium]
MARAREATLPTPESQEPLDLLAVGAHPDDVEISCGGTLAAAAAQGLSAGILDLTRGELGTNGTPEIRAAEAAEAARILDVRGRWNAGLPDGAVHAHDPEQVRRAVEWIRRLRPDALVVHYPRDRHPDHVAASELMERAVYLAGLHRFPAEGEPFRPRVRYHFASRIGFAPSFVVDVTASWDKKRAAILAHRSQVASAAPDARPTPLNREGFLEFVESRARHYGGMIGVRYGEPFHAADPIGIRALDVVFRAPRPAPGAFTG